MCVCGFVYVHVDQMKADCDNNSPVEDGRRNVPGLEVHGQVAWYDPSFLKPQSPMAKIRLQTCFYFEQCNGQ